MTRHSYYCKFQYADSHVLIPDLHRAQVSSHDTNWRMSSFLQVSMKRSSAVRHDYFYKLKIIVQTYTYIIFVVLIKIRNVLLVKHTHLCPVKYSRVHESMYSSFTKIWGGGTPFTDECG